VDTLRPPGPLDPVARAYKDWLHLNVFDHASGTVGLVNASLHGAPGEPASRAVGAALFHLPGRGWRGTLQVRGLDEARLGVSSVALEGVALALDSRAGTALASARLPDDGVEARITAAFAARALEVPLLLPLGSGWISWYVVPRLEVREGWLAADGERVELAGASAYHDHNWGRWHWGDDLGWEWGAFLAPAPGPAFVLSRSTDRAHTALGPAMLSVDLGRARRVFTGPGVRMEWSGELGEGLRRVPGALAALHPDRARPRLPAALAVRADDGVDAVELAFTARAAAQLVTGDPARPGYGFLHQLAGEFTAAGRLDGADLACAGLAVVEYVG
jgi:hypothetical protein